MVFIILTIWFAICLKQAGSMIKRCGDHDSCVFKKGKICIDNFERLCKCDHHLLVHFNCTNKYGYEPCSNRTCNDANLGEVCVHSDAIGRNKFGAKPCECTEGVSEVVGISYYYYNTRNLKNVISKRRLWKCYSNTPRFIEVSTISSNS